MQSTHVETWMPIRSYEGLYEVSSFGRVKSLSRIRRNGGVLRERILSPALTQAGYPSVALHIAGRGQRTHLVPHLVAEAFHGPRPEGMQVCHNDGVPGNNQASNLRWDTPSENIRDVIRHGHHFWANKKQCPRGHDLIEPNLVPSKLRVGSRECLACNRARSITAQNGQPFSEDLAHEKYEAIMARCA